MGRRRRCLAGALIVTSLGGLDASRGLASFWPSGDILGRSTSNSQDLLTPVASTPGASDSSSSTSVQTDTDATVNYQQLNKYQQNSQCPFMIQKGFVEDFEGPSLDMNLWCVAGARYLTFSRLHVWSRQTAPMCALFSAFL